MTIYSQSAQQKVSIRDLKDGMIITAYIGFSDKYKAIDEGTCEWLKHNFKEASVAVERDGEEVRISIEGIQPGDTMVKVHEFPASLSNIVNVNKKLIAELEARGFRGFMVERQSGQPLGAREKRLKGVTEANLFIQKVKESVELCENTTRAVESLLDEARDSPPDPIEIEGYIESIVSSDSSEAISSIISLKKNDQVYSHCVDVGVVFQSVYSAIKEMRGEESVFKDEKEMMLAAFLHDIGKAKLPKDILGSTAPFKRDSREMELIRSHPSFGAEILGSLNMPDYVVNMAHYHHVKLDPTMASSYPKDVPEEDVMYETRLLALIDAYQALVAGRSYKKSWTPPAVMRYLDATAGVEFDLQMWQDFQKVMGHYPKGSFVKLSDDSHAFVLNVPEEDVSRPQVVVVQNAGGENLERHLFIDLAEERDMSIAQDIDAKEFFQESALDVFTNITVV